MRLHFDPPAIIVVTTRGLRDFQAGAARGPLVTIRPGYEADAGLLAHELTHVWHWWLYGILVSALIAAAAALYGPIEIGGQAIAWWSLAPIGMAAPSLAYLYWPAWRAAEEIAAYRTQAKCYPVDQRPARLALFAKFIAERYGLGISAAEALQRLLEG